MSFIKILAIIQMMVVIALLLFAYAIKVYQHYQAIHQKKIYQKLVSLLLSSVQLQRHFDLGLLQKFKRKLPLLLNVIQELDNLMPADDKTWPLIRQKILYKMMLPRARLLASSHNWIKRYTCCQVFQLHYEIKDEPILQKLIDDPIPLISIKAAQLVLKGHSPKLINTVIDCFAKKRRVQQSFFAEISTGANTATIPSIIHRLQHEKNPYTKAFCYHMLNHLPMSTDRVTTIDADLHSDNLDLKLVVLSYCQHHHYPGLNHLLLNCLDDEKWEVRARAAKLIGLAKQKKLASYLEKSLTDSVWWVRKNAAQALAQLGESGIAILKRQDPGNDQFAYDTASIILSRIEGQ